MTRRERLFRAYPLILRIVPHLKNVLSEEEDIAKVNTFLTDVSGICSVLCHIVC